MENIKLELQKKELQILIDDVSYSLENRDNNVQDDIIRNKIIQKLLDEYSKSEVKDDNT